MTDTEKITMLREELRPVLDWYRMITECRDDAKDFIYDEAVYEFSSRLSCGAFQSILEILA